MKEICKFPVCCINVPVIYLQSKLTHGMRDEGDL